MSTRPAPEYVLSTDPVELERLGVQHRLWADAAHALWKRAAVAVGSRVLDAGCGPGYAALDLAQLVGPAGRVVGVDESPPFVAELNRRAAALGLPHLTAHEGDAQRVDQAVPAGAAPFDAAYARWVLCFVPDPGAAVRAIASKLRPGGRLMAHDYFNYESMTAAPREPEMTAVVNAIARSWRDRGGDPDVAGRLPALCADAGLEVEHLAVHLRVARPGDPMWAWPTTFWASVVPRLVRSGHVTQAQADAFDALWHRLSADPTRFMHLPPVYELIAVKR